jgi:DNA mismatch repair protein MutH
LSIKLPYDKTDANSIEVYAKRLLNKTLKEVLGDESVQKYSGKGKLGQALEDLYFQYKPNSNSEPDFSEAGLELKTTPLKAITKGYVSKERLVFNIINYNKEYKESFKTSSFWKKNQLLLLMFYLHEQEKLDFDYIFKIIRLWRFPIADLKIIKDDWEKIVSKIKAGKAHEISEGDTLYLGACTKGANNQSLRAQPFSAEMAMQRAFSLKSKYINFIIEKSLNGEEELEPITPKYIDIVNENRLTNLEEPHGEYKIKIKDIEPVIKNIDAYSKGQTFEDYVIGRFSKHYGKRQSQLIKEFGILLSRKPMPKNMGNLIARKIMGVSKGHIEEFVKADVEMKTIRLNKNGMPKESMSFAQIKYKDIIDEQWDESYLFEILSKRFFFVVFQMNDSTDQDPILSKVMFWTMPMKDLEVASNFWKHTKAQILKGDYEHFYKLSDKMICHVRPKGLNSKDLMETPQGKFEKKKSYWLNASYIKEQINI